MNDELEKANLVLILKKCRAQNVELIGLLGKHRFNYFQSWATNDNYNLHLPSVTIVR